MTGMGRMGGVDGDSRVKSILSSAEKKRRCAYARNQAERMMLRRRLGDGGLVCPMPGTFARREYWDGLTKSEQSMHLIKTEAVRNPSRVFGSLSAAQVYGLSVSYSLMGNPITMRAGDIRRWSLDSRVGRVVQPSGFNRLWGDDSDHRVVVVNGIRVAPPKVMLVECLMGIRLTDGLAIADSALRRFGINRSDLQKAVEELGSRRHGVDAARMVAAFADAGAESGGESIARGRFIEEGYMVPELQREFDDPMGEKSFRADFFWQLDDDHGVIGELDGMGKYTDASMTGGRSVEDVLIDERQRESRLTMCGYPVVRFLAKRIHEEGYVSSLLDAAGIPKVS